MYFVDTVLDIPLGEKTGATVAGPGSIPVPVRIRIEPGEGQLFISQSITIVVDAVALFDISIVTNAITVNIGPFIGVKREGIVLIIDFVAIIVVVTKVTETVVIEVGLLFVLYFGTIVLVVREAVAVFINVGTQLCTSVNRIQHSVVREVAGLSTIVVRDGVCIRITVKLS